MDKVNKKNTFYNGNFFSTEIKFHPNINHKNAKNINFKNEYILYSDFI